MRSVDTFNQLAEARVPMNEELNSFIFVSDARVLELQPDRFMHDLAVAISNFAASVAMMTTQMEGIEGDPEVCNWFTRPTNLNARYFDVKVEHVMFKAL